MRNNTSPLHPFVFTWNSKNVFIYILLYSPRMNISPNISTSKTIPIFCYIDEHKDLPTNIYQYYQKDYYFKINLLFILLIIQTRILDYFLQFCCVHILAYSHMIELSSRNIDTKEELLTQHGNGGFAPRGHGK